jgi:hypothetical protein
MGRTLERRDQLLQPRGDLGDQNLGETAAGLFRGRGGGDLGGERVLMQPLDHGAEQRFLGLEMMVERLPRQPAASAACSIDERRKPWRRNTSMAASRMRSRGFI